MKLETCKGNFEGSFRECVEWLEEFQPALASVDGHSMDIAYPWPESVWLAANAGESYASAACGAAWDQCQWENLMPVGF